MPGLRLRLLLLLLLPACGLSVCMHAVAAGGCAGAACGMQARLLLHVPDSSAPCTVSTATVCLLILVLRGRRHRVVKKVHGAAMQRNPWRAAMPPLPACLLAACRQHSLCPAKGTAVLLWCFKLCCRVRCVFKRNWVADRWCCCGGSCACAGMHSGRRCRQLVQAVAVAAAAATAAV